MICGRVKECMEQTKHILPEKKKNGKKRSQNGDQYKEDIYWQPLSQPPCGDSEQQKKCIAFLDKRSQISCEEKGKTYILDQSKEYQRHEVIKFRVDKGIITDPEASKGYKCDNALLIRDSDTVVLVELKGTDTRHAIQQLAATLFQEKLYPVWKSQQRVFGRVVCKSTPPRIQNTDEYMDLKEALLLLNGNLKIAEEIMVEKYQELGQRK